MIVRREAAAVRRSPIGTELIGVVPQETNLIAHSPTVGIYMFKDNRVMIIVIQFPFKDLCIYRSVVGRDINIVCGILSCNVTLCNNLNLCRYSLYINLYRVSLSLLFGLSNIIYCQRGSIDNLTLHIGIHRIAHNKMFVIIAYVGSSII